MKMNNQEELFLNKLKYEYVYSLKVFISDNKTALDSFAHALEDVTVFNTLFIYNENTFEYLIVEKGTQSWGSFEEKLNEAFGYGWRRRQ